LPCVARDLGTHEDVTELARDSRRQLVAAVDRKREHVGRLVDAEMFALQATDLFRRHEGEAKLALLHSFRPEHAARQLDGTVLANVDAAAILDLDTDHELRRCVPVSSAWR